MKRRQALLFLWSSEGSDVDREEVETKQEVRGGGRSEVNNWPGSSCIAQDPTGGERGGAVGNGVGKAAIDQNDARRGSEGGLKASSADRRIAAAIQKLLLLCVFFCLWRPEVRDQTNCYNLVVARCVDVPLMRQSEVKFKRGKKKEKRCIWPKEVAV